MYRQIFKELYEKFNNEKDCDKKVEILLNYDLKTLTNLQIERLLLNLNDSDTKKLITAISKKVDSDK